MRFVAAALCLALLAALWRLDVVVAQKDKAADEAGTAQLQTASLRATLRLSRELLAERDALDLKHTQELINARKENDRLRADVAAGHVRLSVAARCPAVRPSNDSSAAGLVDAVGPELTGDAGQDYFTLIDQLSLSKMMIEGLQDYVRKVCQPAGG